MIPFFLFRTGSGTEAGLLLEDGDNGGVRGLLAPWVGGAASPQPPAAQTQGIRSLLAFWVGGAANTSVTPPVVGVPGHVGGGPSGGWFSRKKWHDLRELLEAQRRVERLADQKKGKEAVALDRAADKAADAIELINQANLEELERYTRMQALLEAAAGAEKTAQRIRAANQAAAVAARIIKDLEEEEGAVAFFMLNG